MDQSLPSGYGEVLSNGGSENGGAHHGWQKVTNPKKQKRQEARSNKAGQADTAGSWVGGNESKVFQALERDAEEKRAHREAALRAAAMGPSTQARQSDSDAEGDEEDHHDGDTNGVVNEELKKPKVKKPKKPKVTVAEAASAIDVSDLAAFLVQVSESFVDSPDVQLMRFADYFGRAFNAVTPSQFGWNKILKEPLSKAVEIPLCYIPEAVCKTATDWLAARPISALGDFVIWGLNDVVNDMQLHQGSHKGSKPGSVPVSSKTKVGVLAVLALVLRKRPEALLQKAAFLRTSPQFQGQDKLVMLAWAYGQVAQGDLVVGMQFWVQNLLPLACGKNGTPVSRDITLQFAESILFVNPKKGRPILQNGASRKGERLVPPPVLDSVMRVSFPSELARTKATERFQSIYPFIKDIALYGPHKSKATKLVAQQLLPLCLEIACEDVPALACEASSIFVWCLSENPDCCRQWEKLYMEKIKGSVNVLSYICTEWKSIAGQLSSLDNLKATINQFRVQNAEAKGDAKMVLMAMAALVAGAGIMYGFYLLNLDVPMLSCRLSPLYLGVQKRVMMKIAVPERSEVVFSICCNAVLDSLVDRLPHG
ncbi:hypothetical protein GOP47_0009705 [Adiantum capillus-veneris]|uniref:Transmembrane protein n=1 Tax=Adiantum capillus-veneris TaxID=13818 RepID=A0A9D4UXC5_ADICA|nr:hypothetical protein GOP47_0009705 [Adiantum capillus-veneris]